MKQINNKEFDLIQNEYYLNQKQIKSQISMYLQQRNMAMIFAITCILISIALCFYGMTIAHEAKKVEKIVFKEDGTGGLTIVGFANSNNNFNEKKYIPSQLVDYINALYSIPIDIQQRKYNISKVQLMTENNYFHHNLKMFLVNNYKENGTQSVSVRVNLISEIGSNIWQVDWQKLINNQPEAYYKTTISISINNIDNINSLVLLYNPLGILINNVNTVSRVSQL